MPVPLLVGHPTADNANAAANPTNPADTVTAAAMIVRRNPLVSSRTSVASSLNEFRMFTIRSSRTRMPSVLRSRFWMRRSWSSTRQRVPLAAGGSGGSHGQPYQLSPSGLFG